MSDRKKISHYAEYISLGAEIAAGLSAPIFIGYGLDYYFDTSPWLILVGCLIGIINIFLIIFNLSKRLDNE